MAKVTDLRDLLENRLSVLLATEKAVAKTLPRMKREANDPELARGFERHLEETKKHVANLEEAFARLGKRPRRAKAQAMEGLELQHKAFAGEAADDVLPDVLDLESLGAAAATEHHEIAAYEATIVVAEAAGAHDVIELLERNAEQERAMLEKVTRLAQTLAGRERPALDQELRAGVTAGRSSTAAMPPRVERSR